MVAGAWLWIVAGSLPLSWPGATAIVAVFSARESADPRWLELLTLPTGWNPLFTSLTSHGFRVDSILAGWLQWAAMQIGVTLFLDGGYFDRLARDRRIGAGGFFAACGGYFGRFARMGIVAVPVTLLIFAVAPPGWAIVSVLLLNPVFAYAKVRAVVEDRRSAIGSIAAALRFVRRHPVDVFALYLLNALLFAGVLEGHRAIMAAQVAAPPAWGPWLFGLVASIVFLQFAASQIALFQSKLAHAGYTAAPPFQWPDSPAAEAIRRIE
jgi:hypothetical protein